MAKPKQIAIFDLTYGNITAPVTVYESSHNKRHIYKFHVPYFLELAKEYSVISFAAAQKINAMPEVAYALKETDDKISVRLPRGADIYAVLDKIKGTLQAYFTEYMSIRKQKAPVNPLPSLVVMPKSNITASRPDDEKAEYVFKCPSELEKEIFAFCNSSNDVFALEQYFVSERMPTTKSIKFTVSFTKDADDFIVNSFFENIDRIISEGVQKNIPPVNVQRTFPDFMYADLVLDASGISSQIQEQMLKDFERAGQLLLDRIPSDDDFYIAAKKLKVVINSEVNLEYFEDFMVQMQLMFLSFLRSMRVGDSFKVFYPDFDDEGNQKFARVIFNKDADVQKPKFSTGVYGALLEKDDMKMIEPFGRDIFKLFYNANWFELKKADSNDEYADLKIQFQNIQAGDVIVVDNSSYRALSECKNDVVRGATIFFSGNQGLGFGDVGSITWQILQDRLKDGAKISIMRRVSIDDIMNMEVGDSVELVIKEGSVICTVKEIVFDGMEKKMVMDAEAKSGVIALPTVTMGRKEFIDWLEQDDGFVKLIIKANASDSTVDSLPQDIIELEALKQQLGQLNFLKSIISPIEFERKIQLSQQITEIEEKINQINFSNQEKKTKSASIFDDLFNQSFYGLKNEYTSIFADELTDFFAPNGEKSLLNNAANELIRTPQFVEWFGDWQNAYLYKDFEGIQIPCSQVVNRNFEPLTVWHGTGTEFSYFKFDTFPVAYFAVNQAYSKWFADLHGGDNGYTIPFFLNIRNPLDLTVFKTNLVPPKDFFDYLFIKTGLTTDELEINPLFIDPNMRPVETWVYIRNNPKMLQKLSQSHVFDGVHFYETNPTVPEGEPAHSTEVWVAFRGNQIKLADPNRGEILLASLKSFLLEKGGKI